MWSHTLKKPLLLLSILVLIVGLGAACTTDDDGVTQADVDNVTARLTTSEAEVVALQNQLDAVGPVNVVQAGQLAPVVPGAQPTGWETSESIRGGLNLVATYDSSGPDAWDVAAHPVVYFTSEGRGYGHRPSPDLQLPGVQVIDATTKTVIASGLFDLDAEPTRQPHGLGVSPDGQWVYIGYSDRTADGENRRLTLVINARTLKLDKLLSQASPFEWGIREQNLHHVMAFTDYAGEDRVLLEYGFGANGGPHFLLDPNDDNRVVRAINYDDVKPMGHPYVTVDPTGKYLYISMGSNEIRSAEAPVAGIAKLDLETGDVIKITGVGHHPIGVVHTSDGKDTYVADGHSSSIYKIDNETNEVVDHTAAGVAGPYGLRISWDETLLYVMGKGEGTHNVGGGVSVVDLAGRFRAIRTINQPIQTGGQIIDHGILHPDPDVNELWISSAGTFETIVLNLDTYEVTDRIASPNGGDTHSGAFVRYTSSGAGTLLADHANPQAEMWADMRSMAQAVADAR